jgi:RNA polymerase-binding transcription factor DksA
MAIKKKQPARSSGGAQKKAAKPAPKAAVKKPAVKKTVKKSAPKPQQKASKPAPKPVVKAAQPSKSVKPVQKPQPQQQARPVAKPVTKPEPVAKAPVKKGGVDPSSFVSIKQKVKPVVKKEPPKPSKIVIPKTTTKSSVKYEPEFTKSVLDQAAMQSQGPTMRYSDNDLNEFKEIIQKKLDAAKKELSYLQGLITRKDEGGDMDEARYMTMEDGSVSMEREQLSQMASRQITFIDHLEKAMMRIENKTYGICRVTGKLIDKARLRAVPHATLSIEAKQMMNK